MSVLIGRPGTPVPDRALLALAWMHLAQRHRPPTAAGVRVLPAFELRGQGRRDATGAAARFRAAAALREV